LCPYISVVQGQFPAIASVFIPETEGVSISDICLAGYFGQRKNQTLMNSYLLKLGWNEAFQQELNLNMYPQCIPARVIREDRDHYTIHTGEACYGAQLSGSCRNRVQSSLDLPTVGDWVFFEAHEAGREGCIHGVLTRKSLFSRQVAGNRSDYQLLAANIDYLFVVAGLDQEFNLKRVQRFLTQAWNSGAEPVVVLNKSDLVEHVDELLVEVRGLLPGVAVHATSVLTSETIECLHPYFEPGKTLALSGSSGVGKSSLINVLLGESLLKTQANRADDNRGRHTTTWRELIPLDSGACIIDLPGMRELQLTGEVQGLEKGFADIHRLAENCKYRNCRHEGEPGCAIEAALQNGELSDERYQQYLKLRNESHNARRPKLKSSFKKASKPKKWEEKEAFFKEVRIQHRKNQKAKRKYRQDDGF